MPAKRQPDTGLVQPYRPCPGDFRERFLELGQSKELEEHYRTNWRVIRRWIEETGGDELREARARRSGSKTRPYLRTGAAKHHLGIDARARASMAETYLALTKEERAEPADRAIVLASLFKPVADGIVKDDALPLITPASLLSAKLADAKL